MLAWLGYATAADLHAFFASRQHDIDQADPAQLLEDATRFVAQAGGLRHLVQRFPQNVRQKTDQNMGLDAIFTLVPNRPDTQVAFVDPKRGFRVRQLDVRLPQVFRRPIGHVGSQSVNCR